VKLAARLCRTTTTFALLAAAACTAPDRHAGDTIAVRVHEGTALAFDLSPDGRRIVFDLLGQLWEMPAGGGEARPLTNAVADTAEDLDPTYSPDGRRIVFRGERGGRTGLWLLELGDDTPRQLTQLPHPDGYDGGASWSGDGRSVLFVRHEPPDSTVPRWHSRLLSLDVASGTLTGLAAPALGGDEVRDPTWAPRGGRLAVVAAPPGDLPGGRLWLVEAGSRAAIPLTADTVEALAPAFAPDGGRLAFFAPDSAHRIQLWVLSLDSPHAPATRLTSHSDVTPTRVRWTPDGRSLLYGADGRLWRVPAAGGTPTEIRFSAELSFRRARRSLPPARFPEPGRPQHVRAFMGLALSPDARTVAMLALGELWLMPVDGRPHAVTAVPHDARHIAWSPRGDELAWSAGPWMREDLFVTHLRTGSTTRATSLPGREERPIYSSDGRRLAFLHQPSEDRTLLRIVTARAGEITDARQGDSLEIEPGAEALWSPTSADLLSIFAGFAPGEPTRAAIVRASGKRDDLSGMPDSPLFPQWTTSGLVFVRHARLWRAPFDSTGVRGPAEPLGEAPALYASASRDGTVLFLSEDGLRLRTPGGRERHLGWPLSYTPPVAEPVLIRNARIIDGTGRPATPPRDLFIRGGRIGRIAPVGTLDAGSADVVDVEGRFLMPGLIDLHAHVYRPDLLPGYPYFGVTTIRDQGSPIGPLVASADAIAAGDTDGPRLGYGGLQFYSDWAYDTEEGQGVEPEADGEHLVRAVALAEAFGSQHIKTRTFRRWDLNARFIGEAHRRGMRVTGHCAHPLPLVAAGMDAKEHAGFCNQRGDGLVYEDVVQLFRAADIAVIPTISYSSLAVRLNRSPGLLDADAELAPFLPPPSDFAWMLRLDGARRRDFVRYAEVARRVTATLARAGVTIGAGTDIWQIPTGVHLELEELVAAGLSPLEAIRAATESAARILGAGDELGTIEVGKWADLIVLDADPASDVRNSRRIRAVMQAGRWVDRAAILARFP
jgi:Tol biopolymer transport system component